VIFQQISTGGMKNFGYYICDEQAQVAAFVDPSFMPEKFLVMAGEMNAKVQYVFNTHGHEDHTNGNEAIQKKTGAKVVGFNVKGRGTIRVEDGAELALGGVTIRVIHTPGHTEDSICLRVGDCLLTGDTLFVGKVGSSPLTDDARQLFNTLHNLMKLPDASEIYPGHDFGLRPFSTLRNEKDNNPFLNTASFNEFVLLKRYWAQKETPHI
jgi:hydroxyacylglutathione hydrolase